MEGPNNIYIFSPSFFFIKVVKGIKVRQRKFGFQVPQDYLDLLVHLAPLDHEDLLGYKDFQVIMILMCYF